MRKKIKKIVLTAWGFALAGCLQAQDSLETVVLNEVVTTGTRFTLPVEKSGKTIYRFSREDLDKHPGRTIADFLNVVPGVQIDGNFGTPGTNVSYYVRGARNRQTLILLDGIPLNDPSGITAEYDLRFIPLDQVSTIEVLKGGLSTLYGTGAAAGVVDVRLKEAGDKKLGGQAALQAGSFGTFGQHLELGGSARKWSYHMMGDNTYSKGISAAQQESPADDFDRDGFKRQNIFASATYKASSRLQLQLFSAYENFEAEYDAYEFTDAENVQHFWQARAGVKPEYRYGKGTLEGYLVFNRNERQFEGEFPAIYTGNNVQADLHQRHHFSSTIQGLWGVNYQRMAFDQTGVVSGDSAHMFTIDPYVSLLVDLANRFQLHTGVRLNTHSVYGSQLVYNINPSYLLNTRGRWHYKLLASLSTSYVTPSPYQLFSIYGNRALAPEEVLNMEVGHSVYLGKRLTWNFVWFNRQEEQPIDFASIFDDEGNYVGGRYENVTAARTVYGVETDVRFAWRDGIVVTAFYGFADTDREETFFRIPRHKAGAGLLLNPIKQMDLSLSYVYTGDRTAYDFRAFAPVTLGGFQVVDVSLSWNAIPERLTFYGTVNNLFDTAFVAVLGYTTRGRNYAGGVRYVF